MKKVTMFLLAVLLIASLFVSCDTNTNAVLDEHVTVSFSTGSDGRSLGYEIENITNLKWHYSAKKTNDNDPFKFGATEGATLEDFETQIELSQGKWDFKLWANKVESGEEGAKVYEGSVTGVLITKETSPRKIVIDVSPNVGNVTGSIKFEGVQVSLKGTNTDTPVYAKTATISGVNGDISLDNGTATKAGLTPGDYVVTVKYTDNVDGTTVTYASETIIVTVWSGRTTTIKGNVSEETGSAIIEGNVQVPTKATVTKTAASGQTTVFTANVAPSNNALSTKMDSTSVSFPAGILDAGEATLQIKVNSIDSDFSFSVSESPSTVGSISLKLNDRESSNFGESSVTITTYIAKGLSGVQVKYDGDPQEEITMYNYNTDSEWTSAGTTEGYSKESGKLVFTTNHFSEYYVVSQKVVALNMTQNKAYTDFGTALGEVDSGDIIKLYSDITGDKFSVTKSMTIEGNNHTLTDNTTTGRAIWITATGVTLTINDLTIDGKGICERGLQVNNLGSVWNVADIILNNCKIQNMSTYAINLASGTTANMEINDSYISGWAAINAYGTGNTITVNRSTLEGINDKGQNNWNNFATICLEGDTTGQTNLGSSDYQVTINDSTIVAKQTTGNLQRAIGFNSNSKNSTVSLNNTNIVLGDEVKCSFAYDNGNGNKIIINGELIHESPEANCWYSNGPFNNQKTGGRVTNLLLPFDGKWLANGEGIILEKSIELSGDITCQMTSGTFYFYLGNYTLTGGSIIIESGVTVISDKEGLTVFKASEAGQEIACVAENGTYKYSVSNSENSSEETLS